METPPISRSPAFRARTNITMPPRCPNVTRLVGRIWLAKVVSALGDERQRLLELLED